MELSFILQKPLYELLNSMSFQEYHLWALYFEQRPYGWRDDDRALKIMRSMGAKVAPGEAFASLGQMLNNVKQSEEAVVPRAGSFLFDKMVSAKGGDQLGPEFWK
jgi:hypothetical protein